MLNDLLVESDDVVEVRENFSCLSGIYFIESIYDNVLGSFGGGDIHLNM